MQIVIRLSLMNECAKCRKSRLSLQRHAMNKVEPSTMPPIIHEVQRSLGQPPSPNTCAFMKPLYGDTYNKEKIYASEEATESVQAMSVLAHTFGKDIVFGKRSHQPEAMAGNRLLVHKLAHIIQGTTVNKNIGPAARSAQVELTMDNSNNPLERKADIATEVVFQGNDVPTLSQAKPLTIQRARANTLPYLEAIEIATPLSRKSVQLNITLLNGVTDTISRDVARATRIFIPANIAVSSTQLPLDTQTTRSILGSDNSLQTNPSGPMGVIPPSAEELILATHNYRVGTINVYYVPRVIGRAVGGYTLNGLRSDPIIIMNQSFNAGATIIGTLEHELGHALGLKHRGNAYQLMHDGLRASSHMSDDEIHKMRASPYAH